MAGPLVVITGASSGIGLALAHAFAREGHALLLIARHMKPVAELPGERTAYAEADVADYAALESAIRDAEGRFGKAACLVNNAGLADARAFTQVEPAAFAHEIDVNLKGVLNGTKAVIGDMSARGAGTIINISSVSDRKTAPVAVTYTATALARSSIRDGPSPTTVSRLRRAEFTASLGGAWRQPVTRAGLMTHFVTQFSGTVFSLLWGYPFLVAGEGLSAGTAYHYRVRSRDANGALGLSTDATLFTAAP